MLKSDNLAVRLGKMIAGFIVVAVLVMLWPTIVFSFPTMKDKPNATADVKSCEDTGPVTRRGFGHNWNCVATIRDDETGQTWTTSIDMNFFTPDEIGEPQRLTWGYGGGRGNINTDKRTYTQAEGFSSGTVTMISIVAAGVLGIPALWMFSKSVVWSFSQAEQRKFWEKIHGSPEERAAKKKKDQEFWDQMRRNREQRKQARQQRKG
ncbi:hypothetical protein HUO13_30085 [Saccharopolyspora erythraea]|uniref:DUF6346 domain-containing protein n=1 Tax=Saccharopolyspora erythraea TaxID=1836 RepID=UPI001BAA22D8|nr:DUF6346 domain-containing protein [Saccharopolyspora erythraea]QUH04463.1 hypothetical protein HUO13_30085 [Saccharopolyspora erythraea]